MGKLITAGFVFVAVLLMGLQEVNAQIAIEVERDFVISNSGEMRVTERERVSNRYSDRFIPGGTTRTYYFVISAQQEHERRAVAEEIYDGLSLRINGRLVTFERVQQEGAFGISYVLNNRLNPGTSQAIIISYIHPELGERTGGVLDAYIPAFSEDFRFEFEGTTYSYTTRLSVPSDSGEENIVSVAPTRRYTQEGRDIYEFSQESLKGNFVWVQRGSSQVYRFRLTQELPATSTRNTGELNEYRVIIPRDIDELNIQQTVYFTDISPDPAGVIIDDEENIIGVFRIPVHESIDVVIAGYALVENKPRKSLENAGNITDMSRLGESLVTYTSAAEYWEVDHPEIAEKSQRVLGDEDSVYETVSALYAAVIDTIDYSEVKRFGINERQGALKTLRGGAAVCMEYSDLYLSLLRNRGVAARAAFGYGYDSRLPAAEQEAHQWVQVYLPNYDAWTGVDVTWGESGTEIIGGDLNHFYTHVASTDPNTPAVLSRLSIGLLDGADLNGPSFEVSVLADIPEAAVTFTSEEMIERYGLIDDSDTDFFVTSFRNKYVVSWQNLLRSPGEIDMVGWGLILSTVTGLFLVGLFIILFLRKIIKFATRAKI